MAERAEGNRAPSHRFNLSDTGRNFHSCATAVFSKPRSTSATLQAWATQPRGVKDLADGTNAGFSEMRLEAVEEMPRHRAIIGVDLEPRIDERADQPGP